jgi:serine/threonine-protein kinase
MPEQVSSYRLEEEIAHGGMGIVYRGVHTVFDEVVAVKAIFPELTLNPELRERFLNEAKIQRRLQHPHIVQIREFLIDQGKFYIVMEFIEGETLAQHLRQLGRPMLASEAIPIFRQALEGLGFAHAQGVVHRDIKPSNIMLTRESVAKLTDFGIARALGTAKLTRTGTALGTPAYMSPEQIQGTKLDHRTDIYSMGIALYEMLTGRVPFERPKDSDSDFPILAAHINQAPTPPSHWVPEMPPFLEAAALKALAKRPEDRFQSCQEFQAAIAPSPMPSTIRAVPAPQPSKERVKPPEPRPQPPIPGTAPVPPGEREKPAPSGLREVPPQPGPERAVSPQTPLLKLPERRLAKKPTSQAKFIIAGLVLVVGLVAAIWYFSTITSSENPKPMALKENPKDGLKYVLIPPGTFMMGCSPGDNECEDREKPSHQVTITKGFWLGQTEVTVGAYKRFAGATRRKMPYIFGHGWANDNMPIDCVTWNEAHDYCTWVGGRLPTEAEWEYAARGGSTEARYGPIDEIAWFVAPGKEANIGTQPHEVGQKRANGFWLFDVLGNVEEWVNDWYDPNYYRNSPSQDPPGPASGEDRVQRGGCWRLYPSYARVSNRGRGFPNGVTLGNGFRCVREANSPW